MSDAYDFVAKEKLKLKSDGSIKKKKKKKSKDKDKDKEREALQKAFNDSLEEEKRQAASGTTASGDAYRSIITRLRRCCAFFCNRDDLCNFPS